MKKNQKGTVIIIAVFAVATIFTLGGYLLNSTLGEATITESVKAASKAYYIAEGGINEALWSIRENKGGNSDNYFLISEYSNVFESNIGDSSYSVTIKNILPGYVEVVSIGQTPFLDKVAKRKIKVTIFRAMGSPTYDAGIFTGSQHPSENIDIDSTKLEIIGGNLFGGSVLSFKKSTIDVSGEIIAGQVHELQGSIVTAKGICSGSICDGDCEQCPYPNTNPPKVDFYDGEHSFLSRATKLEENNQCNIICEKKIDTGYESCEGEIYLVNKNKCVFSSSVFDDILSLAGEEGRVTLENQITYIDGLS